MFTLHIPLLRTWRIFLALSALSFMLLCSACHKQARFTLIVEGGGQTPYKLYLINKGIKTDITPTLPEGYTFDGYAEFARNSTTRILVDGKREVTATIPSTSSSNSSSSSSTPTTTTYTTSEYVYFSCDYKGKDVRQVGDENTHEALF